MSRKGAVKATREFVATTPKAMARVEKAATTVLAVVTCFLGGATARAQKQSQFSTPNSDLGRVNLGRVAASAAQIKGILIQDPGLMLQLKLWVAKDASDHGQIVGERDLADDAIFQRLDTDIEFRSVATQLVQQYGYLVPKVNPDSEAGREQALLIQERVKWLAQDEETQRQAQHTVETDELQKLRACAGGAAGDCGQPLPASASPAGVSKLQATAQSAEQVEGPPEPFLPNVPQESVPAFPSGPNNSPQQFQLTQDNNGAVENASPFDFGLGTGSGQKQPNAPDGFGGGVAPAGFGNSNSGSGWGPGSQSTGMGGDFLRFAQAGFSMSGDFNDGLGVQGNGTFPLARGAFDESVYTATKPSAGLDAVSPANPAGTPVSPSLRMNRPSPQPPTIEPVLTRVPDPYRDIPSLYDMYLQASPHTATLQPFGAQVFENGIRDPQLIPTDLPANGDYVVGPGDGLAIDLWGSVSQRFYRTVDREGRVSLPEVGPVLVSGKSLADAQQYVQQVLRTQFREVSADVTLAKLRTIRIYEVGEVANPGAYDISSLSTPLNALFAAGGPTTRGSLRIVKHYRGNQLVQTVDLYDLLLHGVKSGIDQLENGDTVLVPPAGPEVSVEGMVRRPAIYELKDEKTLASVLELAGGLLPAATLRHIEVQRLVTHEKQTMLSLDIPETDDNAEATQKLESFQVQDGDRIRIFPIAPYSEDAVYVEGHVLRPGRYSYRKGMRVTDLITSYKDVLPEPAGQYAEIIRLNPPDFHPSVEGFDLAQALENPSTAPVLQALDTVRLFGKYDFENPPVVSVLGDVRAPGTYQTSGQIHLSDAVHLARGLEPDAQTDDAQIFRPLPDGRLTIFSVNLSEALAGVPSANIALEPRDRVLIHRSPDSIQPASVYVEGAVGRPGRYPLTTNMTVADVIKASGGLAPGADPQTADLTTYRWVGDAKVTGEREAISIAAAMSGESQANVPLHNGDVVTIRQLPGWSDLGASISVRGEVKNPGSYGIRPGERLSSVLERAEGFQPDAYPYGAVLQRVQVRELEAKQQDELILRVKDAEDGLDTLPDSTPQQKQEKEAVLAQYHSTLLQLTSTEPLGRVDIEISSDIKRWKNSSADIEVQGGDVLFIPKRPSYVMVTGQVFNPTAISYHPGKSAKWYLSQAGGPTTVANKKAVFVIRADGSVLGTKEGLWSGDSLDAALRPGDTVVVPEKALGGGVQWQTLFTSASIASSIVSTVFIAAHY